MIVIEIILVKEEVLIQNRLHYIGQVMAEAMTLIIIMEEIFEAEALKIEMFIAELWIMAEIRKIWLIPLECEKIENF